MGKVLITFWARVGAVWRLLCPRCGRGELFRGWWAMNRRCQVCELEFEREPGYFTGAMYISYGLAVLSVAPTGWLLFRLAVPDVWLYIAIGLQLVLTSPLLFRYSRTLWLHLDQLVAPR